MKALKEVHVADIKGLRSKSAPSQLVLRLCENMYPPVSQGSIFFLHSFENLRTICAFSNRSPECGTGSRVPRALSVVTEEDNRVQLT